MDPATIACPGCGHALTKSAKQWKCPCGARWVSNIDFAEMVNRMQDGYGPDGVAFDERTRLWQRALRAVQERGRSADRECPICSEVMKHVAYKSVELDHCESHGIYFDPNELQLALERAANDRPNAPVDVIAELDEWLG